MSEIIDIRDYWSKKVLGNSSGSMADEIRVIMEKQAAEEYLEIFGPALIHMSSTMMKLTKDAFITGFVAGKVKLIHEISRNMGISQNANNQISTEDNNGQTDRTSDPISE